MRFVRHCHFAMLTMAFISVVFIAQTVNASGSDEESPADISAERAREAVMKYNNGVKHMKKGKEVAQKGDSAYAFNYRATSDAKARKAFEKAINDFIKAISLKPGFVEAYNNLGYCYRKTGELKKSLDAYDRAIEIDDKFEQAREYRGETFLALGELAKAENELKTLRAMESSYADTLALAIQLYRLAKIDEKLDPENSERK